MVSVDVPPLHAIAVADAEAVSAAGWLMVTDPATGPQLFASVTLQLYVFAESPENTPVLLLNPPGFTVYVFVPVPPDALMVNVAVPPLHAIAVADADAVSAVGWLIVTDPVTGPQLFASVTLQLYVFAESPRSEERRVGKQRGFTV